MNTFRIRGTGLIVAVVLLAVLASSSPVPGNAQGKLRAEQDSLGAKPVPAEVYFGMQAAWTL